MSQSINPYEPPAIEPSPVNAEMPARAFDDAPIATFRVMLTDAWHDQAFGLLWKTKTAPWRYNLWMVVVVLPLLTLAIYLSPRKFVVLFDAAAIGYVIVTVSLGAFFLGKWLTWRQSRAEFRKLADYNGPAAFVVYREGLVAAGFNATSIAQWATFSQVAAFPDGVVVVVRPNIIWLLPAVDMIEGNLDDVRELVRQNGANKKEAA